MYKWSWVKPRENLRKKGKNNQIEKTLFIYLMFL